MCYTFEYQWSFDYTKTVTKEKLPILKALASASYAYTNSTCHIYKIDDDNTYTLILRGAAECFFYWGSKQ